MKRQRQAPLTWLIGLLFTAVCWFMAITIMSQVSGDGRTATAATTTAIATTATATSATTTAKTSATATTAVEAGMTHQKEGLQKISYNNVHLC